MPGSDQRDYEKAVSPNQLLLNKAFYRKQKFRNTILKAIKRQRLIKKVCADLSVSYANCEMTRRGTFLLAVAETDELSKDEIPDIFIPLKK